MKVAGILSVLTMTLCAATSYGQPIEPEVPGDNFSLEGALELFKKSESPEEFERLLNSPDSKVNNLDLNGDGYIDYIRVFDRNDRNVHAFILQAVISDNESQDIAVIELEKLANGKAVLQIVGDEDIYGVETIIEPTREVRTYAGTQSSTTVVNVWTWPSVQYVYSPYYSAWYSPWGWHTYPVWYRTWRPVTYVHYYPIYTTYRPYYAYCHTRRIHHAHHIYSPYRRSSIVVINRHRDQITRYRSVDHHDRYGNHAGNGRRHSYNSRSDRSHYGDSRNEADDSRYDDSPGDTERHQRDDRYNNRSSYTRDFNRNEVKNGTSDSRPDTGLKRSSTYDNKASQKRDYSSPSRSTSTSREAYKRSHESSSQTPRQASMYRHESSEFRSPSRGQSDFRKSAPVQRQITQPRTNSYPSRNVESTVRPQGLNRNAASERKTPSVERKTSTPPAGGRDRLQRGR